jgi:hypothetical protein
MGRLGSLGAVGVAFAGVNMRKAWPRALEVMQRMAPDAPAYVAFDAEVWLTRLDLALPALELARAIEDAIGRATGFAVWHASIRDDGSVEHKGIDDAIVAGEPVLRGLRAPNALVFRKGMPRMNTLRKDLAAAGIPFKTDDGVVDFHALRVTYCTLLARAGVGLAQAQRLMRHSDPKLTANIYTRLELSDGQTAVDKINVTVPAAPLSRRRKARKAAG